MKQKLTIAAIAAMLAAPTMADTTAAYPICWEVGASYNFPTKDIINWGDNAPGKKVHTLGADVTAVYKLDENNAATLRLGYATGSATKMYNGAELADTDIMDHFSGRDRYRLHTFTLMPGYRYTKQLNDKLSCFAGVNAGLVNASLKVSNTEDHSLSYIGTDGSPVIYDSYSYRHAAHASEWGFAYSVELGATYAITENISVFLAYQFSGNSARPKFATDDDGTGTISATQQVYHSVRAGVGFQF